MNEILRVFLPIYGIIFLFSVFLLRTLIVWKRTGVNAYALLEKSGPQGITGFYFKILPFLSALSIILYSFFSSWYDHIAPMTWLENTFTAILGIVLLLSSLVWIWISQAQMRKSWRIGVDNRHKTELVTTGIFSISRNPIFLGIKINSLGFFLILPNAVTLVVLLLGIAVIDMQVALEEDYLSKTHGNDYLYYCQKVRRWL